MNVSFTPMPVNHILNQGDSCTICLEDLPLPSEQVLLYHKIENVYHVFHKNCLDTWIRQQLINNQRPNCPICKQFIVLEHNPLDLPVPPAVIRPLPPNRLTADDGGSPGSLNDDFTDFFIQGEQAE